jgi:hypothetical protein
MKTTDALLPMRSEWKRLAETGYLHPERTTCVECGIPFAEDDPECETVAGTCEGCAAVVGDADEQS